MKRSDYERLWAERKEFERTAGILPCFIKRGVRDRWLVLPTVGLLGLLVIQVALKIRSDPQVAPGICGAILGSSVFNAAVVVVLVGILFDRARSIWTLCKLRLFLLGLSRIFPVLADEAEGIMRIEDNGTLCERTLLFCKSSIGPTTTEIEVIDGLIQRAHSLGLSHEEASVVQSLWRMIDDLRHELCAFSLTEAARIDLALSGLPKEQKSECAQAMGTTLESIPRDLRSRLWRVSYLCRRCPEQVCENIAAGIQRGLLGKRAEGCHCTTCSPFVHRGRRFQLYGIHYVFRHERSQEATLGGRMLWTLECKPLDLRAEHNDPEKAANMLCEKVIDLWDRLGSSRDDVLTPNEKWMKRVLHHLVKEAEDGAG